MGRPFTAIILSSLMLGAGLGGCGLEEPLSTSSEEPTPVEAPETAAREAPPEAPLEEPLEEAADEVERAPEEMSRPELEAACFEGRQAACDLLGH